MIKRDDSCNKSDLQASPVLRIRSPYVRREPRRCPPPRPCGPGSSRNNRGGNFERSAFESAAAGGVEGREGGLGRWQLGDHHPQIWSNP